MPSIRVERPDAPPLVIELPSIFTVGSKEGVDLCLDDPQISPEHLTISLEPDGDYYATDLQSTYGSKLNRRRLASSQIVHGDVIEIGSVKIQFLEEADAIVKVKQPGPSRQAPSLRDESTLKLQIFYELARALRDLEDIDALLGRMLEAILDVLKCERGLIAVYDRGATLDHLRRIVRIRPGDVPSEIVLSRTLIDVALTRRQGVIMSERDRPKSMAAHRILSAMAVPLVMGQHVLGFIYVDDRGGQLRFREQDLDFLDALAHFATASLENAHRYYRAARAVEVLWLESPLGEIVGDSAPMQRLKAEIRKYAMAPSHVLIRGESGTGKELVARTLHAFSPRRAMPLVTLNCAAIPETMVESELFGHKRGAFTGALSDKRGKFILADGGTLFLDEIGDLSLSAQAKVLRAVQQGEVQPLGAEETFRVNVRIISATHKDLEAEVLAGRFREDLFYRLNVLEIVVPPLRERADDIPKLAHGLLMAAGKRVGKRVAGFSREALAALAAYRFPGNVRELQNEAERAAIVVEGGVEGGEAAVVDVGDLSARIVGAAGGRRAPLPSRSAPSLADAYAELEPAEKGLVEEALARGRGNVAESARLLGISRSVLKVRMKRFGLDDGDPE